MGKANVSRQALVEAIATLETQRGLIGDEQLLDRVIDTVLLALRDKLAQAQANPDGRRHHLSVLVADLSGFTALSERMDVESVRDAINAMWGELDAVVRAWGGQIDQHAGDSLTALFGLPRPRRGDAGRALRAALAMQQELALFNKRVRQAAGDPSESTWADEWPGPEMRIGIHSGPVYFAHPPGGAAAGEGAGRARQTAVGDAVAVARRLEKLAPAGGVLTSATVQRQSYAQFLLTPVDEYGPRGGDEARYLVAGERPTPPTYAPGAIAGQVTRLIGRAEQMDRLELALQAVTDSGTPGLATLVGPPGVGKSRLIYEFEAQSRALAGAPVVLRAGTQGVCPDFPYALARDLLLRRFDIRPQHSRYLIEHKLRRGLAGLTAVAPGPALGLLERLLDAHTAADIPVDEALAAIGPLLRAIAADGPVIVVLEGINRADRQSLALVDRLARDDATGPVLFLPVVTTFPAAEPIHPLPWTGDEADVFSPIERIDVPPLSPVEARLMATQILGRLAPPSMRLLELIVAEAGGSPLYIESFVGLLIARGILTVGEPWRVDMARAEAMPPPPDLLRLTEAHLAQLPEAERAVLRLAAVVGPLAWDAALLGMKGAAGVDEDEMEAALLSLENQRYLARDDVYSFGGTQAYAFGRDTVRQAAYAGVDEAERRRLHVEAAHWLIANQNEGRFSAWFPVDGMIADHLEAAGDAARADAWRLRPAAPAVARVGP